VCVLQVVNPSDRTHGFTLANYTNLFPIVRPRDFRVTAEASPAYFYHPAAASFFRRHRVRAVLLLRHPVSRWLYEFQHRVDQKQDTGPPWLLGSHSFQTHVHAIARTHTRCGGERSCMACVGGLQPRGGPCCVSPVVVQSWYARMAHAVDRRCPTVQWSAPADESWTLCVPCRYDLFLPLWLPLGVGDGMHIEFSEVLFAQPADTLTRVARFLALPTHSYDTHAAFNTHARRGIGLNTSRNAGLATTEPPLCTDNVTLSIAQRLCAASVDALRSQLAITSVSVPDTRQLVHAARRVALPICAACA
jgi:hypothetical protein